MAVRVPIGPELDLHPFHPRDVVSCVQEFVSMAAAAGLTRVRLIHGRGTGMQRAAVHRALRTHPCVIDVWDDPASHLGASYASLRSGPDRSDAGDGGGTNGR